MPNYRLATEKAAKKYNIDPQIFLRQINAESNFNPNAGSPAGAKGIAQFIPSTAAAYGVNLNDGKVADDLDGAARYMRDNLKKYGSYARALSAYNSGRPDAYKDSGFAGGETYNYVKKILQGADIKYKPAGAAPSAAKTAVTKVVTTTTPGTPGTDNRKEVLAQYLLDRHNPEALSTALSSLKITPGTPATTKTTQISGPATAGTAAAPSGGTTKGADAALSWARSTIGVSETGGANRGPRVDQWEQRFGLSAQPWCAMFTSLAATKGGMAKSGRTPSVREVRVQATNGSAAYQRGFVPGKQAKAGDLILFGNDHIGMVESVGPNGITMIAGNDSNKVQRRTVSFGSGDIVRPKYGR